MQMELRDRTMLNQLQEEVFRVWQAPDSAGTCGVIAAGVRPEAAGRLIRWRRALSKEHPDISFTMIYLPDNSLIAVLLPGQKLGQTHFISLLVKDLLDESEMLIGTVVAASMTDADCPDLFTAIDQVDGIAAAAMEKRNDSIMFSRPDELGKVLLVDGDEVTRVFLNERLLWRGYHVFVAANVEAALQLYEEHNPSIVITELVLPESDGFSLIRNLRTTRGGGCPIIVLTERRLDHDVSRAFELGASDYLCKPFSPVELDARIRRLTINV